MTIETPPHTVEACHRGSASLLDSVCLAGRWRAGGPSRLSPLAAAALVFAVLAGANSDVAAQQPQSAGGTVERITVHGRALEGNLEGNSPDRNVVVYLPPGYASQPQRRYPVIYFLHGYGATADAYAKVLALPGSVDRAIAAGARETIVVIPDAFTKWSGSMYSNSPTIGDWETFIARDLTAYMDEHYRTIASRDGRGLAGHSMGGYGTMRIGMKHPGVFAALYAMSSCCLMNDPAAGRGGAAARGAAAPQGRGGEAGRGAAPARGAGAGRGAGRGGGMANAPSAQAAAWAPNPNNPPDYFDTPTKDGEIQPLVAAKWVANSPLVMVDQYVPALTSMKGIFIDVGDQDGLAATNRQLDEALTRLKVTHTFEVYEGDHGNRVTQRFETKVLPFFSQLLTAR